MTVVYSIIRESNDKLADVRVSLGLKRDLGAYLVFRGEPEEVVALLEQATEVARTTLASGEYEDHRSRGQG